MTAGLPIKYSLLAFCLIAFGRELRSQSSAPEPSPAERKIETAKKAIAANPQKYQFYNDLGLGLVHRARETSDPSYYKEAEEAVDHSSRLAPGNFEAQQLRIMLLLGRHEYARAQQEAKALNRRMPDDILVWGYLADADIALGDYDDAEKSAQWMLDLRPGNIPGLLLGARLRALYGDFDGAMEFLNNAYQQTLSNEVEELAYYLVKMADFSLDTGRLEQAASLLGRALQIFPGYDLATVGMARVRIAEGKFAEAVDLLRRRNPKAVDSHGLYELAEALERAGQRREAEATYRRFQQTASAEVDDAENANRDLIFYYADHAHKPAEALRIARIEIARRRDVETLDAYAWALYANASYAEARTQLDRALAVGVRNALYFYHAGLIQAALKQNSDATRYFKQSLDLNPFSEVAAAARSALEKQAQARASATLTRR
jgi:tetratricopeptide (TPR) repeat protein